MLVVLISWIYMSAISLILGISFNALLKKVLNIPDLYKDKIAPYIMIGFAAQTVYAQVFSLFAGVSAVCHVLLLIGTILPLVIVKSFQRELIDIIRKIRKIAISYEGLFYLIFILFIAFFTSRGTFHTDTGIYHAQAIHYIEVYGSVKGLANIQQHLGYNSSYLPFCALYTFSWIPKIGANAGGSLALHTATGWIGAIGFIYSCYGLRRWNSHKSHMADFARIAFLIYIFTNLTGFMSPATDYSALMICHYILVAWIEAFEEAPCGLIFGKKGIDLYKASSPANTALMYRTGMLSVFALFAASMKLSAATLVLIVIYPLIELVKNKKFRQLGLFILIGFLAFLPFLIRNVIISGWLLYPFASIDLFNVEWKVPVEYLEKDSAQITVWGRCLYDVTRIDDPISEWLPIWWEGQAGYGQMLIYGIVLSVMMNIVCLLYAILRRIRLHSGLVIYVIVLYINIAFWFLSAPFIRYGLAFLLTAPLVAVGLFIDILQYKGEDALANRSVWKVVGVIFSGCLLVCFCDHIDNYMKDDLSFVKQNIKSPYYIAQQPFDYRDEDSVDYNGYTIYIAGSDEVNSYYKFPGVCYRGMLEQSEMMGDKFEDGWKAIE